MSQDVSTGGQRPSVDVGSMKLLTWAAALLWGLQYSFLVPSIGFLLVALYGASAAQVGLIMAIYSAAGFGATLVIPAWADRRASYLPLMLGCAALTVPLALTLWLTENVWVGLAALVLFGAPAGTGNSLFFAHLHHVGASAKEVINTRAIISFAWVAGPPLATFLIASSGPRAVLPAIGLDALLICAVSLAMMRSHRQRAALHQDSRSREGQADETRVLAKRQVVLIVVAFVLMQATNAAALSIMTLYVGDSVGLSLEWAGIALGVSAALEVPALLIVGRLTQRFSKLVLVISGCLAGLVYYLLLVVVNGPVMLLAAQVFNAYFIAVVAGAGLSLFQEVIPGPGLASGIYTNTRRIGTIISGPMIAVAGLTSLGYGGVWLVCAAVCLLAVGCVVGVARQERPRPG